MPHRRKVAGSRHQALGVFLHDSQRRSHALQPCYDSSHMHDANPLLCMRGECTCAVAVARVRVGRMDSAHCHSQCWGDTSNWQARRARGEEQELTSFLCAHFGEDLHEELDSLAVVRVPMVCSEIIHDICTRIVRLRTQGASIGVTPLG